MTGKPKHIWLIWAAVVTGLFAYLTQPFIPHFIYLGVDRSAYYIGVATSIVCMSLFANLNFNGVATFTLLALTINNLADEVFFEPLVFTPNEVALVLVLLIGWYSYWKIKEYENFCD